MNVCSYTVCYCVMKLQKLILQISGLCMYIGVISLIKLYLYIYVALKTCKLKFHKVPLFS